MKAVLTSAALLTAFAIAGCNAPAADVPSALGRGNSTIATSAPTQSGALYDTAFERIKSGINAQIETFPDVPLPEDAGGGYTHEQHKRNARALFESGLLFEATGDERYRDFYVRLLNAYAKMYPTLGLHPKPKEQSPGRLFWQSLNEAWFLVHAAQGYDYVRPSLDAQTRSVLEDGFFHPIVEFLSEGQPGTFDKIHNHGTWATAAVGLTGYALNEPDYVEKALLGLDRSGTGGFLRQMEVLFSPDGYYNEGPYYQRYALMPFVLFAQAIQANEPERAIFEARDGILQKAIYSTIHQNYAGLFFPINDAIKDKGIATTELLHGVAIAYELTGDATLLSVAQAQGTVIPTPQGRAVSEAIAAGKAEPFAYRSLRLRDGANGDRGALDILRADQDPEGLAVVVKNTAMGLGHGHFDKLGLLVFDRGEEILRDYGAARFLNIEAKYGGHYLAENNAYAKQTIAHNALVVDRRSHFDGDWRAGEEQSPELGELVIGDEMGNGLSATSARMDGAYPGVTMLRHVALLEHEALQGPVVIDVVRASGSAAHDFDLPYHYNGQLIDTNYDIDADTTSRVPLGEDNGFQYFWKVGEADLPDAQAQTTLLLDRRFYTLTSAVPEGTHVLLAELGANDPHTNLRREPALILRAPRAQSFSAATVFEPHGEYNPIAEYTVGAASQIRRVDHVAGEGTDVVILHTRSGEQVTIGFAGSDGDHTIVTPNGSMSWKGPYALLSGPGE